jgi:putrescine aminotransferase
MKPLNLGALHIGETVDWGHGFEVAEAHDSIIIGTDGREYIDFSSGWNAVNVGWRRPEIKNAIIRQLDRTAFRPTWCASDCEVALARKLVSLTPDSLDVCFRATGGAEANEIALLLARAHTHKPRVLSFVSEYHGGTFGALSTNSSSDIKRCFGPLLPGFVQLPLPPCFYDPCDGVEACQRRCFTDIQAELYKDDVAAVITEAILTNSGVFRPGRYFFPELRRRCRETGALLIIDEIGTGFGRTGRMFASEHFGLVPDIMTIAKALSGGYVPIGAAITNAEIARSGKGTLDTPTFGWTPLACAAALANIEILEREQLCSRAADMGEYLKKALERTLRDSPHVGRIRGVGMEIAVDVVQAENQKWYEGALRVVQKSEELGLVIELSGSSCAVLIMPPLVIEAEQVNRGLAILADAFDSLLMTVPQR